MGITTAMHWQTIENWYHEFRLKRQFHIQSTGRDSNLPPFLQQNPDVCTMIKEYAWENLTHLSVELISEFILLRKLVKERTKLEKGDDYYEQEEKKLLQSYGLTIICLSTIYRWMKLLGFRYGSHKKGAWKGCPRCKFLDEDQCLQ